MTTGSNSCPPAAHPSPSSPSRASIDDPSLFPHLSNRPSSILCTLPPFTLIMAAFVPAAGVASLSGAAVGSRRAAAGACVSPPAATTVAATTPRAALVPFPYRSSGYGSAGVAYPLYTATSTSNIVDTLADVPVFSTLRSLLAETGLDYELAKAGPFTLFAPTDEAFAGLLEPHSFATLAGLLRPENRRTELRRVLAYHILKGSHPSSAVCAAGAVTGPTLAGVDLTVMGYNKKVTAGSARVVKADVTVSNGVIHVVNSVLLPSTYVRQPTNPAAPKFFQSTVQDVYANTLTPRQAIGIDPLPAGYDAGALSRLQ